MKRSVKIAITVSVLVAVQVGAVLVYRAVEKSRRSRPAAFAAERVLSSERVPSIAALREDGTAHALTWPSSNVRLVHFWATWCEPCREELPGLLALGRQLRDRGIEVVAIAVDDEWRDIRQFFSGEVPPEVVVANDKGLHKQFGVSTLPDTYLVDRSGKIVERYFGARDWTTQRARDHLLAATR